VGSRHCTVRVTSHPRAPEPIPNRAKPCSAPRQLPNTVGAAWVGRASHTAGGADVRPGLGAEWAGFHPDVARGPLPARAVRARGHFPTEQAALKCLYLVTRSLDPTGKGRARWITRWKPALNAFAITFEGPPNRQHHQQMRSQASYTEDLTVPQETRRRQSLISDARAPMSNA
jgi:hypothetical protein